MSDQRTLFDDSDFEPIKPEGKSGTVAEQFETFNRLNPWVHRLLERLTADMVSIGRKRVGVRMLVEVIRWQYFRSTVDPNSDFKINNNYCALYARLILRNHPEWKGVFELRRMKVA